jgi:hypothetical protein
MRLKGWTGWHRVIQGLRRMKKSKLKAYLDGLASGPVDEACRLANYLAAEWDSLDGAMEGGMEGYKLKERMESVVWCGPILSFEIERHGAACGGSKYAEVQAWEVNFSGWTARIVGSRKRLLEPTSPRLNAKHLSEEVVSSIAAGRDENFLTWSSPDKAKIEVGKLIPTDGPKQTLAGRRKRFNEDLVPRLEAIGWAQLPGKKWAFERKCSNQNGV